MSFHVPEYARLREGRMGSDSSYGNNGAFTLRLGGRARLYIIASDGLGWEHVSVSVDGEKRCPTWEELCEVKALFWGAEDCVVQYHPPASQYVNRHPYTLHLWRPIGQEIPLPDTILV